MENQKEKRKNRRERKTENQNKGKQTRGGDYDERNMHFFFINDIFEWFFGLDVKGDLKHSDLILNNFAPNTSKN